MLKVLNGMPPGVLAVEASGKVTHSDYRDVLIPIAEEMIAKGPVSVLYVIGNDFNGYELGALWDDGAFGIKHWRDFRRVAVVSDERWVRAAVTLFKPFVPCPVRVYGGLEGARATAWVSSDKDNDQAA